MRKSYFLIAILVLTGVLVAELPSLGHKNSPIKPETQQQKLERRARETAKKAEESKKRAEELRKRADRLKDAADEADRVADNAGRMKSPTGSQLAAHDAEEVRREWRHAEDQATGAAAVAEQDQKEAAAAQEELEKSKPPIDSILPDLNWTPPKEEPAPKPEPKSEPKPEPKPAHKTLDGDYRGLNAVGAHLRGDPDGGMDSVEPPPLVIDVRTPEDLRKEAKELKQEKNAAFERAAELRDLIGKFKK